MKLELQVKELTRNNGTLRNRIWLLEDGGKALRADITQRAREYDELVKHNESLVAEENVIAGERDDLAAKIDILRAEKDVLQISRDALMEGMGQMEEEMDDLMKGKEALLVRGSLKLSKGMSS